MKLMRFLDGGKVGLPHLQNERSFKMNRKELSLILRNRKQNLLITIIRSVLVSVLVILLLYTRASESVAQEDKCKKQRTDYADAKNNFLEAFHENYTLLGEKDETQSKIWSDNHKLGDYLSDVVWLQGKAQGNHRDAVIRQINKEIQLRNQEIQKLRSELEEL